MSSRSSIITKTNLPGLKEFATGKVRDVYRANGDLLIVATDRLSAFDCVLPNGIPRKGEVLTQLSVFWFDYLKHLTPTHFISADVNDFPVELRKYRDQIENRSMLVRKAEMIPVECVARGYISGSGWKEYKTHGSVCGIPLPAGLRESEQLAEPIFTPATKAHTGHDENVSFDAVAALIGHDLTTRLRDLTLAIYNKAFDYARERGILIADTKFEFGFVNGELILGDEALTPDSSRFWPRSAYAPGGPQQSYDKQFVRDYLESVEWDKQPPAPELPEEIIAKTSAKYLEAYSALTGRTL
ncbi:MAG: phosphoribosylaminoimidazolesuccinocarboxamide synthase [Acidobacteriota bacterium]|nr:phosphoribosylaminoimidazolesuccinocarboxamide synthase [Acidobacteriota bacterium]